MRAEISRTLLERLIAEAAASPEREVCGLLFSSPPARARDERVVIVESARSATNVSTHPAEGFEIDAAMLFAAYRAERAGGPAVLGHYHSHPNGRREPSLRDAAASAGRGQLWLILGAGEARLWEEVPGGAVAGAFEPVTLEIIGEAGCAP